jgi:hypothetical protein
MQMRVDASRWKLHCCAHGGTGAIRVLPNLARGIGLVLCVQRKSF